MNFYKDGRTIEVDGVAPEFVPLEFGTGQKFKFSDKFEIDNTLTPEQMKDIQSPSFNQGDGSCDNFALEIHLQIHYEPIPDATIASF